MAPPPKRPKERADQLSYAEAEQALEATLKKLQDDDLPLEQLPDLYAEALALEERCRMVLDQVIQDVQLLDPASLSLSPLAPPSP
jgi:exodeoxyribonuclease VII small subunit